MTSRLVRLLRCRCVSPGLTCLLLEDMVGVDSEEFEPNRWVNGSNFVPVEMCFGLFTLMALMLRMKVRARMTKEGGLDLCDVSGWNCVT
jgi:hypothetical protein